MSGPSASDTKTSSGSSGAPGAPEVVRAVASDHAELSLLLKEADQSRIAVVAGGVADVLRFPKDGNRDKVIQLDLSKFDKIIEHAVDDQVIHVQTGIKVSVLNDMLKTNRQFVPLRVPSDWTILDAVSQGESGSLQHGYGGMRDLTLGATCLLADGAPFKCGGSVVKNVTGYDVTKLIVGSHSCLAIPLSVNLRLYALPESSITFVWTFDSLWSLMNCGLCLLKSGLPLSCLEAVRNDKPDERVSRYVLFAQVFGMESVTKEIAQSVKRIAGASQTQLTSVDEENLWSDIAQFFLAGDIEHTLHIVSAISDLPDILDRLPFGCRWQARLKHGRITAICPDLPAALKAVAQVASGKPDPIIVSYADDRYNVHVRRLPKEDRASLHLKDRIKKELDPNSTLNPYVQL